MTLLTTQMCGYFRVRRSYRHLQSPVRPVDQVDLGRYEKVVYSVPKVLNLEVLSFGSLGSVLCILGCELASGASQGAI